MTRRSPLTTVLTLIVLIAIPLIELWLLIKVGEWIGVLPTVGIVIAEALVGGWLMKREGRTAWRALNTSVAEGRAPTRELTDAALVLVGGVLLIIPGFLTDLLGFICLVPFTRPLARLVLGLFLARRLAGFTARAHNLTPAGSTSHFRGGAGDLIEGEVVDDPASSGRASSGRGSSGEPVVIRGELDER